MRLESTIARQVLSLGFGSASSRRLSYSFEYAPDAENLTRARRRDYHNKGMKALPSSEAQLVAVLPQPAPLLLIVWALRCNERPESRRMISFFQVRQFVDHDVV